MRSRMKETRNIFTRQKKIKKKKRRIRNLQIERYFSIHGLPGTDAARLT